MKNPFTQLGINRTAIYAIFRMLSHTISLLGVYGISIVIVAVSIVFHVTPYQPPLRVNAAPQTYNIDTSAVSGFGGQGDDAIGGSKITPEKKIIIAGDLDVQENFNAPVTTLNGGGRGFIAQLNSTGTIVEKITRFSSSAGQIEILPNGTFVVASTDGVFVFSADLSTIVWSDLFNVSVGNEETYPVSVDVAPNGSIALLYNKSSANKTIRVYNPQGNLQFTKTISVTRMEDIAIDNTMVYVTGFNQKDGGQCSQWQSPYIYAYTHTGDFVWKAYDFTQTEAGLNSVGVSSSTANNCADTRGKLLDINPATGNLIWVARSDGGNSVVRWKSRHLWSPISVVSQDYSSNPASGSAQTTNIVELNTSGEALQYQVHSSRLTNASGNSFSITSLDFDNTGEILLTGQSAAYFESRNAGLPDAQNTGAKINGNSLPSYSGVEMIFMQISPRFEKKRYLNTVSGTNCLSNGLTMSGYGDMIFVGGVYQNKNASSPCQNMLVHNEMQTSLVNGKDGFFAVFGNTSNQNTSSCVPWKVTTQNGCVYNTPNTPPSIQFTNIVDGQEFLVGNDIPITVQFSDPENYTRRVAINGNGSTIAAKTKPFTSNTFSYNWSQLPIGTHYLYATVQDDNPTTDNPSTTNRGGSTVPTERIRIHVVAQYSQNQSSASSTQSTTSSLSISQYTNTPSSSTSSSVLSSSSAPQSTQQSSSLSSVVSTSASSSSSSYLSSSVSHSDTDPIDSGIERGGPHNGDGNNDGIPDSEQDTVATFTLKNGSYVTVQFDNSCTRIETISPVNTPQYSQEFIQFTATCNEKAFITTYWHGITDLQNLQLIKYNPQSNSYENLNGTRETKIIRGLPTFITTHTIIDNSESDFDIRNGVITDPFGLGIINQSTQNIIHTTVRSGGISSHALVIAVLIMVTSAFATIRSFEM